jgi:hypothetical protein
MSPRRRRSGSRAETATRSSGKLRLYQNKRWMELPPEPMQLPLAPPVGCPRCWARLPIYCEFCPACGFMLRRGRP